MKFYLLLLLPAFTSQLGVQIDVALQKEDVNIQLLGEDDHVIEDSEIIAFRLHDQALKDACASYSGGRPTDAYLRSPTPWGDLYQKHGWTQVHRLLKPIKATVLVRSARASGRNTNENGFNGHYFWRYDVNAVMHAGGVPGSRVITDVVKVGFYADANIEVDNDYRGA